MLIIYYLMVQIANLIGVPICGISAGFVGWGYLECISVVSSIEFFSMFVILLA